MDNGVNVIVRRCQVKNQPTKTGKQMFFLEGLVDGNKFSFSGFDSKVHECNGQDIELVYEQKGVYRNIKSWKLLPQSQQTVTQAPAVSTLPWPVPPSNPGGSMPGVTTLPKIIEATKSVYNDPNRQESIERQSAMAQAINLVSAMYTNGAIDLKATAKKDPEIFFATVMKYAVEIKEFVQKGSWEKVSLPKPTEQPQATE